MFVHHAYPFRFHPLGRSLAVIERVSWIPLRTSKYPNAIEARRLFIAKDVSAAYSKHDYVQGSY